MDKSTTIIIIIVIVIAVGVGIYFFTQKPSQNVNNQNTTVQANTNVQKAPVVNYTPYTGDDKSINFQVVSDWTSIAPEELMKSLPEETKKLYTVLYYSTSPQSVVLSVSKRSYTKGEKTISQMLDSDVETAQKTNPEYAVTKTKESADEITFRASFKSAGQSWTTFSKALLVQDATNDFYYAMEVTMLESLAQQYQDIANYLLNSFKKAV